MFEYTCTYTAIIGLMIGGLLLVKYFLKKPDSSIPIFAFPSDKRKNFYIIQKSRFDPLKILTFSILTYCMINCQVSYLKCWSNHVQAVCDGTLPKIFLTDGLFPLNAIRAIVFTDFELINQAFKKLVISSRPSSHPKSILELLTQEKASGLPEFVDHIGLKTGNTKKAIESSFRHIGSNSNIFESQLMVV